MVKTGIVGCGLAGLAVGSLITDAIIFEAEKRPGGLLRTEKVDGYTFDTGGSHIIFSKNEKILRKMLTLIGSYVEHRRRTFIHYNGRFIKYPFENGISMLPKEERFVILKDFVENLMREKKQPENLLEWFYYVFGREITERYLKPYNEKIWKRDLEEISLEWVGGRVPNPPVEDILKSAVGIETEGYTHQLRFFYPLKGGIEALARSMAQGLEVRTDARVKKISSEDRVYVETVDGSYDFDRLIFTAPLTTLPKLGFKEVKVWVDKLECNSLTVVGLGVKDRAPNFHWLYFPQEDVVFHRVAFLSNYSPYMAPKNGAAIIAEISTRRGKKVSNVCDKVIDGLNEVGFDFNVEVCKSWHWEYAYVVYNHHHRQAVNAIGNFLVERKILPFGRFGEWEYLNMDAVMERAEKAAKEVERL